MNIQPTKSDRQRFLEAHAAAMAAYTGPITVIDGFTEIAPKKSIVSHYDITPESHPKRFRPVPGFKYYLCRDDGYIWSKAGGRYLVSRTPGSDSYQLAKHVSGKTTMHRVHGNELKKKIWGRAAV